MAPAVKPEKLALHCGKKQAACQMRSCWFLNVMEATGPSALRCVAQV